MKMIRNERGVALVMVMILALIALAVVSGLLFMVTQGTRMSGYHRFFRTAEEAGLGGVQIERDFIRNLGVLVPGLGTINNSAACMDQKLAIATANWTACPAETPDTFLDPTVNPDTDVVLGQFRVLTKIVNTVVGNSDRGNVLVKAGELKGEAVVESGAGTFPLPLIPYLYRIEVQSQDKDSPREVSRYSVLYAY